ncbi:hypothetical protein B0H14DRAFT_3902725 [Mycena olivaceomarginata]|nr:hypothetical protein B0H14DRAFT_3902725 [Mycena olivaceomarginata]
MLAQHARGEHDGSGPTAPALPALHLRPAPPTVRAPAAGKKGKHGQPPKRHERDESSAPGNGCRAMTSLAEIPHPNPKPTRPSPLRDGVVVDAQGEFYCLDVCTTADRRVVAQRNQRTLGAPCRVAALSGSSSSRKQLKPEWQEQRRSQGQDAARQGRPKILIILNNDGKWHVRRRQSSPLRASWATPAREAALRAARRCRTGPYTPLPAHDVPIGPDYPGYLSPQAHRSPSPLAYPPSSRPRTTSLAYGTTPAPTKLEPEPRCVPPTRHYTSASPCTRILGGPYPYSYSEP